ncbi:netrin-1 [Salvelinus namaycush]|uniref:Netrin-1 n=1 Tax=Salvelinus namaycush TaxID=8040 RepID=A0A8U0QW42_SALNM|nr:netrin-1 [Salvelinus namaycush]
MMFLTVSPPPSFSLSFLLLVLTFLPPSLLSRSLSHSPLSWTSPHDPCYHLDGRPRHCLSEFINAAYGVPVSAANSLRGPPDQNAVNVSSVTDLHNPYNLTCWTAQVGGSDGGDWVLTLPLGRRFEVTYISLQFCQQGEPSDPVSVSLLKSMDHGRTWRPMQHYSSDCPGRFGLQAQTVAKTRHQETEPLCSDPRPLQRHRGGMVLAFSTLDGRPSSPDFDYSPTLQDWVTATDIRVVFHQVTQGATIGVRARKAALALSDLQVGGRCKCNGHASRCRHDDADRAVCVCEHHTAGADCDVCEDFYYDRPWQRATPSQPHPCVPCECNGHSSKCRFSMEVFQQSGRRSGGVCLKCRHHTAGRHCQYCQNGHTRDHGKLPNHHKACQSCLCHPMGAVGRWCNQTSGQCLCRDGVTGLKCNRCALGYKQGRSPLRPCIRIQEVATPTTPVYQPQYSVDEECVSYCQPSLVKVRMNLETYCLKDFVLKLQVRGMERSGPWWQFSVWIQTVFRTGSSSRVRRGPQALWVPDRDLGCGCPALQVGRTFLLIGAEGGRRNWGPEERRLVADRSTLALQWREHWNPKLRGFRGQDKRGRCPPKLPGGGDPYGGHSKHHYSEYTPPHLVTEKETEVKVHPHKHSHSHTPSDSVKDMEEEAENSVALDTNNTHTQSSSHHRPGPSQSQEQQQEQTPSTSTPSLVCSTQTPV